MTTAEATRPIAKERQTSLGLYVTAKEAYDMWQADPEAVKILDVRTPEEFVFTGHAPMAWNIPFAFLAYEWNAKKKAFPWGLNPDFVAAAAGAVQARRHAPRLLPLRRSRRVGDQPARGRRIHERLQHPRRHGRQ